MPRLAHAVATFILVPAGLVVPMAAVPMLALTATPVSALAPVAGVCDDGQGVTVVVDRAGLGGGTTSACDGGAGGAASDHFAEAGVGLTYAQREPGFVCQVDGLPGGAPCVGASASDAYWSLWWSDGTSGRWTYATVGIGSLEVPAGGSVALRFSTGERTPPAVAPPVVTTGTPSAGAGDDGRETATAEPLPGAATGAEQGTALVEDPGDPQAAAETTVAGLPAWVAPVVLAGLLLVGGGVAVRRRPRGAPGRP